MGTSIEVHDQLDGVLVRIAGEVDLAVVDPVRQALEAALAGRPKVVRVDLAAVRLLDSTFLSALWLAHQTAAAQSSTLILCDPNPLVAHVLQVSGFMERMRVEAGGSRITQTG